MADTVDRDGGYSAWRDVKGVVAAIEQLTIRQPQGCNFYDGRIATSGLVLFQLDP